MRNPFDNLDEDMGQTPPQTEDSHERGFIVDCDEDDFGRSEELDQEDGDIADETPGRRG
jgi:hypothetical protein